MKSNNFVPIDQNNIEMKAFVNAATPEETAILQKTLIDIRKIKPGSPMDVEMEVLNASMNLGKNIMDTVIASHYNEDKPQIIQNNIIFYNKGAFPETYDTIFGKTTIHRNVYQSADGGKTVVPFEYNFNTVRNSTPCFARLVSFKAAHMSSNIVYLDLQNHGLSCSRDHVCNIAKDVGEEIKLHKGFTYQIPEMPDKVATISVSLDGTTVLIKNDGYREAMVGTISLFNEDGDRMFTMYTGAGPEKGKSTFLESFKENIHTVRQKIPLALVQGIADGAPSNWTFLDKESDVQVTDFFHCSQHVHNLSRFLIKKEKERDKWLSFWLHRVKHTNIGVDELIDDIELRLLDYKGKRDEIKKELNYIVNQKKRMRYATERRHKRPIGSGPVEAACKTLIKQRLGISGAKWTLDGADTMINLRALILSTGFFSQFWNKAELYGFHKRRK